MPAEENVYYNGISQVSGSSHDGAMTSSVTLLVASEDEPTMTTVPSRPTAGIWSSNNGTQLQMVR